MYHDVSYLLSRLINGPLSLRQIYFASSNGPVPDLAYQVDFPRLEIVLEGEFVDTGAGATLVPGDVLYVARRGPRIGSFLLQTLNEMQMQPQEQQTARLIVASLLSHCRDLLGSQIQTASRSQALFEAIRDYIDERYASALTRESVAQAFYISPNYLSHLFQKTGAIGFNEYLNHTRLEHAKTLLKGYDLKVKEVAHACGFVDSNYFCRLFRKNTERSPSEYRRQYHSQLTEKPTTPE
ncbi:TPA: helix-turn-helix transcriptional regulator [Shigella sonnei]|nr:helix-turn-helix transcriptional regulator [Shigella sonnei]